MSSSPLAGRNTALPGHPNSTANLADILERMLDKGIVIAGDIQINLLDIELLTIKLRLLVASVDRAKEMGIDWWEGDPMLSPSVTNRLIAQLREATGPDRTRAARDRIATLTEREHDVAVAVGMGLTNAEIARRLHLSVPTVKAHIGRLFAKLDATNRVQIAICVHDAGLT